MTWTAPATATTGQQMTAAFWNTQVRDNFLETSTATVTTAGDLVTADAANSMGTRLAIGAADTFLVSDGSNPVWRALNTDVASGSGADTTTTYTTLGDAGTWNFASEVSITVQTGTKAFVFWKARISTTTAGAAFLVSYSVSGATTVAASDARQMSYESGGSGDFAEFGVFHHQTGLTVGSNIFTLEARVTAGTGTIVRPEIAVMGI